mmetsp:Transcript_13511/g.15397  ORF Transcript_13511/g.15397 Transcript_13511/m.15397 type:complete len:170 (+) Transcript_13511:246-755(+)
MEESVCPLFVCPGNLGKDFKNSKALQVSGALIQASGDLSDSESSDVDDPTPSSSYYDSTSENDMTPHETSKSSQSAYFVRNQREYCKRNTTSNGKRRQRSQTRPRLSKFGSGRYQPYGKKTENKGERTKPSKSRCRGNTQSKGSDRKGSNVGIGEIQAYMSLWQGISKS